MSRPEPHWLAHSPSSIANLDGIKKKRASNPLLRPFLCHALIQERRRLAQQHAERLRQQRQREENEQLQLRAVAIIQAAFRRRLQRRERREAQAKQQQRASGDTATKESAASACLQRAWRRHKADQALGYRRRRRSQTSPGNLTAVDDDHHASKETPAGGNYAYAKSSLLSSQGTDNREPSGSRDPTTNNEGVSWQGWSPAFEVDPAPAAETARGGEEDAAVEAARPRTAAAAVEASARRQPATIPSRPQPPPAGMMTVTVRRGSEETSLVTPIVLTENGEGEEGGAATTSPHPGATARPSVLGGETDGIGPGAASSPAAEEAEDDAGSQKGPHAVGGGGPAAVGAHADKPVGERGATGERDRRRGGSAEVTAPPAALRTLRINETTIVGNSLSLPSTKVTVADHGAAKMLSVDRPARGGEAAVPGAKMAAGPGGSSLAGGAGSTQAASSGQQHVPRATVKPTAEQFFMEDTQVYLGCAACGVKYLVEAVEPGPEASKSKHGEFRQSA